MTEPVLQHHATTYSAVTNTSALIRDVQLVGCILLAWRVWERADSRVWHVGLQALAALVRGDHPHRGFNVQQMQNALLVNRITMIFLVGIDCACVSNLDPVRLVNVSQMLAVEFLYTCEMDMCILFVCL